MRILLLTGESGAGKTTIAKKLAEHDEFHLVKSYTTRKPRNEQEITNGDHYFLNKTKLAMLMNWHWYVALTMINNEIYTAFEKDFHDDKINVYVVDEVGMLDAQQHVWSSTMESADCFCIKILNQNNRVEEARKERYSLWLPDEQYNRVIVNDDLEKTVSMIREVMVV